MLKQACLFIFVNLTVLTCFSQTENSGKKGSFYTYWGWNRGAYSKSDITFTGNYYHFELFDVIAKDRQSAFNFKTYFAPAKLTIPQYNFRFGYYFHDKYSISIGADHMKYVMQNWQTVKMTGEIAKSGTAYDGTYDNADMVLYPDFLKFEHTDGLNYENIELRREDCLLNKGIVSVSVVEGFGVGVLVPRTNTTLLGFKRYDEFHVAGYGLGAVGGLNIEFWKHFFIQCEGKFGFINMPDIRTTEFKADRAKQHFWFAQINGVFGLRYKFQKPTFRKAK